MRLRYLLAAAAGCITVGGYAPFGLFPITLVGLALLVRMWGGADRLSAGFMLGWWWGLGLFLAGVSWLFVALHRFGGMPAPLAGVAIVLFCGIMALFPALAGAAFVGLRRGGPWRDALLVAGLWALSEWSRGVFLTGFPWLAVGYSQTPPSPLAGFVPVLGVYGVGGLLMFAAAVLALPRAERRVPVPALLVVGALLAAGVALRQHAWTQASGAPLQVALLQTNVEQAMKWRPEMLNRWLKLNLDLVRDHPAELVVLPETTLPLLAESLPTGYLATLGDAVEGVGGDLVFGVFVREGDGRIRNAALSLGVSRPQHYAKRHLVPFGEYSPPLFGWFYDWASIPMSDQSPGDADQPPMQFRDQRIAVNICYEDVFGAEIADRAIDATILLNLSNLAWYGDSLAQPQHLQISQMRALETGRPMLRATNTGMTAVIAADGRVSGVLPPFHRDALRAEVQGRTGVTPYLRWGDNGALALAAMACGAGLLGRRRPDAVRKVPAAGPI